MHYKFNCKPKPVSNGISPAAVFPAVLLFLLFPAFFCSFLYFSAQTLSYIPLKKAFS